MIAAFFHDERFARDASGTYHSSGALPYAAFARYLGHFERIVVVGRVSEEAGRAATLASGPRVEWACVETPERPLGRYLKVVSRRAREVLAGVDCAIMRLPSLVGSVACHEALRLGTPWMAEVVADSFDALWNHGSLAGKALAWPMHLVNRHYIERSRFSIYVTRGVLQRRYAPGGAWVAASNVVIDRPRRDVLERRLARIDARAAGATTALGLVGSYDVAYKGHETALRALALLRRSGRAVTLHCIGVGDPARWRARAQALGVGPFVELGAALPHGRPVLEWMDRLDLYIVPSFTEGLPRGLIEAMSCALPAVGSRTGGIPELLDAASLHRPRDARALARLVEALAGSRDAMRAQAERNWSVASEYAADVLQARRDALVRHFKAEIVATRERRPRRQERAWTS